MKITTPVSVLAVAMTSKSPNPKRRILCLHGKFQTASSFSNKIAGARRKLARVYDLHFLDGPIVLEEEPESLAWWERDDDGKHILVQEAFDYVLKETNGESYDAIIGFSQGGALATALALSGVIPGVKAVVTAGAPMVKEVLDVADQLATTKDGRDLPKLHLAGETDNMVSVESTRVLCQEGGNGELIVHEQGHLFPTRAIRVNYIMDFLARTVV
jgi:predicted esterase